MLPGVNTIRVWMHSGGEASFLSESARYPGVDLRQQMTLLCFCWWLQWASKCERRSWPGTRECVGWPWRGRAL